MGVRSLIVAASVVVIGVCGAARAETALGNFKQWKAYAVDDRAGKTCVAASQPTSSTYSQAIKGRGDVFFVVASIPNQHIRDAPSAIMGYPIDGDAKVTVAIDDHTKFTLAADKDIAWFDNTARKSALIAALRGGSHMVVHGKSRRGTATTDVYSLAGFTAALRAIAKECR